MNIQQIIDAAEQMAVGMGLDPNQSPVIDSEMTAEDLLPLAFRHAYLQLINSGGLSLQDVMREHEITLTLSADNDFIGTLPVGVLTEHLDNSSLPEFPYSSWLRYFMDYKRQRYNNLLCYFVVENGVFHTTCGVPSGSSGVEDTSDESSEEEEITLHAPSIPVLPANAATNITMPQRALDAVIYTLALALRGELKLIQ